MNTPHGLTLDIPGRDPLVLTDIVLDFNGTLACDGILLPGIAARLARLTRRFVVHVVTGDTYGTADKAMAGQAVQLTRLSPTGQGAAKQRYIEALDPVRVVAIGNGRNDCAMLRTAALGIAVIGPEGACGKTLAAADVVVAAPAAALDLLLKPSRLIATLRA